LARILGARESEVGSIRSTPCPFGGLADITGFICFVALGGSIFAGGGGFDLDRRVVRQRITSRGDHLIASIDPLDNLGVVDCANADLARC